MAPVSLQRMAHRTVDLYSPVMRASPTPPRLPKVILSSVVRSTHQGESHGGVYLVDMQAGGIQQVIDWNDPAISWEGRGADRGLRGIAFNGDRVFLAASDEVFFYDPSFRLQGSIKNRYLKHCHEITVDGDLLYMTSTGFDSILEYDLNRERFLRGYCLRFPLVWRARRRLRVRPRPRLSIFDPEGDVGPDRGDTCHVNNIVVKDGTLYVAGTGLGTLWRIREARLERFARIPYGSHNARPFHDGVLLNHTASDRIVSLDRSGRIVSSYPLATYDERELINTGLSKDMARQAFGRGLAVVSDELIVGGSSPATITAYRVDPPEVLRSLNVSMDLRNAVHGLEVWPFDL
jgi:hypothetical protein